MSASIRTLIYAGVAVCCAGAAYMTHQAMQPPDLAGFDLVGQEFYPNFDEPASAAKLRVAAYDDLKEESQVFAVEKHGDNWRIPSHHDYPAEAKKRLAETAASVMGVKREAVAGRRQAEHERYGVIDPLDEKSKAIRGRGQRITLYDEAGKEIVDLIIGNQVEGQSDQFYVRLPSEKETYRSTLNVKLSTKFSDWIEPDLLKLTTSDLVALRASKPIFEEKVIQTPVGPVRSEQQTGEDKVELTRTDSADDWKLADLDEDVEEFEKGPVSSVVTAIDDLKIIGVRPKPRGIRPDFTLDIPDNLRSDPRQAQEFARERVRELMDKGFGIFADDKGQPFLSAREGELIAGTKNGVVYNLHFGNRFEGSLDDIEFGAASSAAGDDEDSEDKKDADKPDEGKEAETGADDSTENDDEDDTQEGRYVLVRVEFDAKQIGEEPVPPVEPKKPADAEPRKEEPKPEEKQSDDKPADNKSDSDKTADESTAPEEKQTTEGDDSKEKEGDKPAKTEKSPELAAYEEAMKEYESKKIKYESDKEDYDKKVADGTKTVAQLNERFQDWYYVISASSFESLRLSRETLIKAKDISEQPPVLAPVPAAEASE